MLNSIETFSLRINKVEPKNHSSDIDINNNIRVHFNSDLDTLTITSNFYLLKDINNIAFDNIKNIDITKFEIIKGSLSYQNRRLDFKPTNQLDKASRYIIYIPKKSIKDFEHRVMYEDFISVFDTDEYASYIPCNVIYPSNNSIIDCLDHIKIDDINSSAYIVQISRSKEFENGIYDEVVNSSYIDLNQFKIGDGSYYIRVKATNGPFGEVSFFTIKTIESSLVSDEDDSFIYKPLDDTKPITLLHSFPDGINVHEKTNLMYMDLDGVIDSSEIDFYESGLYNKAISDSEFSEDIIDGTYIVINNEDDNKTYVSFVPDKI